MIKFFEIEEGYIKNIDGSRQPTGKVFFRIQSTSDNMKFYSEQTSLDKYTIELVMRIDRERTFEVISELGTITIDETMTRDTGNYNSLLVKVILTRLEIIKSQITNIIWNALGGQDMGHISSKTGLDTFSPEDKNKVENNIVLPDTLNLEV